MSAGEIIKAAASICLARVEADPDACGGGAIGYHAIGRPGACAECIAEAKQALAQPPRMVTVILRELPGGVWHATAATNTLGGLSFTDNPDPVQAVAACLGMVGVHSPRHTTNILANAVARNALTNAARGCHDD